MNNSAAANITVDSLIVAALTLPPADRAEIAERLLSSLEPAVDPSRRELWIREAQDRAAAIDRGELPMLSRQELTDGYLGDFAK